MPTLQLAALSFADLYQAQGIEKLDTLFLSYLKTEDKTAAEFLKAYRQCDLALTTIDISDMLIKLAKHVQNFIVSLFKIENENEALRCDTLQYDPIFQFKKAIVLKKAKREINKPLAKNDYINLGQNLLKKAKNFSQQVDDELAFASYALHCLQHDEVELTKIIAWCIYALKEKPDIAKNWVSLQLPQKINFANLVDIDHIKIEERDGFALTDNRMSAKDVQAQINYCVYCHEKEDDFCSKGFPQNKRQPELGFKKNPLGVTLTGCPLDEKISEMHSLKKQGLGIAALAMVMRDNPMCPATGHRICNDCMKACIYQKQDPVNIPEIETRVLTDVLNLPWGVEIYSLFTRWNPLRQKQYRLQKYNDYKIMVVGLGPAGFTLAHHLLMEGCHVSAVDGLKIEPLTDELINQPIYNYQSICENLDERTMMGFGGVAEYGITNRWDKNFLKLIYITLARHQHFTVIGNVRFGGTVTVEDAKNLGFDHLSIAVGAGLPKALPIPNSLAPGMRQANDFLMNLQLSSAMKENCFANLQVRMPIVVIGGGLTGVDTATEAQAYYVNQVEKTLLRYRQLLKIHSERSLRAQFSENELVILDEHLQHAQAIEAERLNARKENRDVELLPLLQAWGGVSIVYRRQMQESPAYISNHEELTKALEQGIIYRENAWPVATILDEYGQVKALRIKQRHHDADGEWQLGHETEIAAKTILVATGAKLNIAYSFEHPHTFAKENGHYIPHEFVDNKLKAVNIAEHCKIADFGPFTSYQQQQFKVSFIGDSHPAFHGNVVKAIASAYRSYGKIMQAVKAHAPQNKDKAFKEKICQHFMAYVEKIENIAEGVAKLTVHCPVASQKAKAGQFFRLQNFETQSQFSTEPMAMAVSSIDKNNNCLTFIIIDKGVSSVLCQQLKSGDRLALMGPTGVRSKLHKQEKMLIIGSGLANIQAQALAQLGDDSTQITLLSNDERIDVSNAINKIISKDCLNTFNTLPLQEFDRILAIGDKAFLQSIKLIRDSEPNRFKSNVKIYVAAYAPMQCMMKGVCAQCLVWQKDPVSGQRKKAVYACSWQHQPLELLDIDNLFERLSQNTMQEKLSRLYFDNYTHVKAT